MEIDDKTFEAWMERIMDRFDQTDEKLEKIQKSRHAINGINYYDNQDICTMLRISKRTLQRYRSLGALPYQTIYHKTYYKETDVFKFIREHFDELEEERV